MPWLEFHRLVLVLFLPDFLSVGTLPSIVLSLSSRLGQAAFIADVQNFLFASLVETFDAMGINFSLSSGRCCRTSCSSARFHFVDYKTLVAAKLAVSRLFRLVAKDAEELARRRSFYVGTGAPQTISYEPRHQPSPVSRMKSGHCSASGGTTSGVIPTPL